MRYMVTGGAGFIGSNTVDELVQRGHSVVVLDDLSSGKEENLSGVCNKITLVKSSVTDIEAVREAMHEAEYVLHLAARTSVPRSVKDPLGRPTASISRARSTFLWLQRRRKSNAWCLLPPLPPMARRPLFPKSKPCSRSPFPLTASPSTWANFTVRRFSNATASKPFPSATSIFLARARIPVRPTLACSPNFAARSSNTRSRSFSATASRPATSHSWTTPSTPICSLAKRLIWRAKSLILAAAGAFLSMKSWPRSERSLATLWRRNTIRRARETFAIPRPIFRKPERILATRHKSALKKASASPSTGTASHGSKRQQRKLLQKTELPKNRPPKPKK